MPMMDFYALAQECAPLVAPATMAAIVKTESGFKPFAIGVNGGARLERQPANKEEAVVTAKWLIANGYNIDLGLGQVNSANLGRTGLSVEDAFEPCKNIAAAASILHGNYRAAQASIPGEQAALQAALSAYNTGTFHKGFANGYVQKVLNNAPAAAQGGAVRAVMPIPVVGTKPVARMRASMPNQPVRLTAQREGEPSPVTGATVFNADTNNVNVMVY